MIEKNGKASEDGLSDIFDGGNKASYSNLFRISKWCPRLIPSQR